MCSLCECRVCEGPPHAPDDHCDGDKIIGYYDEMRDMYIRYLTPEQFEEELNG